MLSLLFDAVIFSILYACMSSNMSFLKMLIIYILCYEIKFAIMLGIFSFSLFLTSFGIFLLFGFITLFVLQQIRDSWGLKGFIILGVIIQHIISIILSVIC